MASKRRHDASTAWYGVHASLRYCTKSAASVGGAGGDIGSDEERRDVDLVVGEEAQLFSFTSSRVKCSSSRLLQSRFHWFSSTG